MTIDELNALITLTAADEVPVWDNESSGEPTKKITAQNMANSVKTLGSLMNTTEMNAAIAQSTAIETGSYTPTLPEGIEVYSNGCKYSKSGKVVVLSLSFKLSGSRNIGKQYVILHNLPINIRPNQIYSVAVTDGTQSGVVPLTINSTAITIYAQKNQGNEYFIGTLSYIV